MTDKLDPTAWAHTGDGEYDEKHGTVLPTEEQVSEYVQREYSLPTYSAVPFAAWLIGDSTDGAYADDTWESFTDPTADLPITIDGVISGAVRHWCGGRTR